MIELCSVSGFLLLPIGTPVHRIPLVFDVIVGPILEILGHYSPPYRANVIMVRTND